MNEIRIIRYSSDRAENWNDFNANSKNGHFIFAREYMEYHSDRFKDYSLLCYSRKKLVALLPANIDNSNIVSHGGLTFGGFIVNESMTASLMLDLFQLVIIFYSNIEISNIVYKPIPNIYHRIPAQEDLYALFINNAILLRRDISTTIQLDSRIKYQERRRRSIKRAKKENLKVLLNNTDVAYDKFWEILGNNLIQTHGVKPVHSLTEITQLKNIFPDNIKLFISYKDATILAGVLIYENELVAHAQYISSSEEGKKLGAIDIIFDYLINTHYEKKKYFDFGTSNENDGRILNKGLIAHKEGFGARAVAHDYYKILL
jgi:hypothetical protein